MAEVKKPSRITLKLQTGVQADGTTPTSRNYSFGNLDPTTTSQDLKNLALSLKDLTSLPLLMTTRVDTADITSA